jgi:hypothetical protein
VSAVATRSAELLTPPERLRDAADDLRRQGSRLDRVRSAIAADLDPAALVGRWEGRVAEAFVRHVDARHRQKHLDVAHDRLGLLALALERAAEANEARIAQHRRMADEIRSELARQGDLTGSGLLPTSLRDTAWPRWHRAITGGGRTPATTPAAAAA